MKTVIDKTLSFSNLKYTLRVLLILLTVGKIECTYNRRVKDPANTQTRPTSSFVRTYSYSSKTTGPTCTLLKTNNCFTIGDVDFLSHIWIKISNWRDIIGYSWLQKSNVVSFR